MALLFYCGKHGEPGGAFLPSGGQHHTPETAGAEAGAVVRMTKREREAWREQQAEFYVSGVWIDCARAYRDAHPLCERCLKKREISPSEQVHHKIRLSPENINDPMVTLNWDNLEALCDKCHKAEHRKTRETRWSVDEDGRVTV